MPESTAELVSTVASPLVSIIVPAFNAAAYIGDALNSLRAQTVTNIEIIVVDDGSTDGTGEIAARHASEDMRVRLLTRDKPSGTPSCARNDGLRAARARYIAFLDADDTSFPHRLQSALDAMELTGARFVFADVQRMYQSTGELVPVGSLAAIDFSRIAARYLKHVRGETFLCEPAFPAYLLTHIVVNTPTVVFDRELLSAETTWFDESLVCAEDVDLWFRLAEHTPIAYINEVHSVIRKHAASLTATQPVKTHIDSVAVRSSHFNRLKPTMTKAEISAVELDLSRRQYHVAYAQWRSGDGTSARSWYLGSWSSNPSVAAAIGYFKSFIPRARLVELARALGRSAD